MTPWVAKLEWVTACLIQLCCLFLENALRSSGPPTEESHGQAHATTFLLGEHCPVYYYLDTGGYICLKLGFDITEPIDSELCHPP